MFAGEDGKFIYWSLQCITCNDALEINAGRFLWNLSEVRNVVLKARFGKVRQGKVHLTASGDHRNQTRPLGAQSTTLPSDLRIVNDHR